MASTPSSRASSSSSHRRRRRSSANESQTQDQEWVYALPDTSISEWLKCPICLNPFVDPIQASKCEHIFCKGCIDTHLNKRVDDRHDRLCPSCRSPMLSDQLKPAASLIRNMVDSLLVKCPHEKRGCSYTCERSLMDTHATRDCGWAYIGEYEVEREGDKSVRGRCECGRKVLRRQWHTHLESGECTVKRVRCPHADDEDGCRQAVKESEIEDHLAVCPSVPTKCRHCLLQLRREAITAHEASCPEALLTCTFARFGCPWRGRRNDLIAEHLSKCQLAPLEAYLFRQEEEMKGIMQENSRMVQRMNTMEEEQRRFATLLQSCVSSLGGSYIDPQRANVLPPSHEEAHPELVVPISSPHHAGRPPTSPPITLRGRSGSVVAASDMPDLHESSSTMHLASTSAPASHADLPWQWPEPNAPVNIVNRPSSDHQSRTVSDSVIEINQKLTRVFDQLNQLDRRLEESHVVGLNANFEASRAHEELNNLRHGLHALRISIIMQQQRNMPGNNYSDVRVGDTTAGPPPTSAMPFPPGSGPSMMGLRRFWTGMEHTKL